jgi:hypothetical protein
MRIYKEICDFIVETSCDASYYEDKCIQTMQNSLFQGDNTLEDFVNGMERDYFEKLFEYMKTSWQALI